MCVLLIGWHLRQDLPLVVAANRDEAYARAAVPPERQRGAAGVVLAPRDLQAGGTWEGVNEAGLVVVITNRRDAAFDASRPSRGGLCRGALELPDAGAAARWLEHEVRARQHNGFNIFLADRDRAAISSWDGAALSSRELAAGTHALSNEHAPGELVLPELEDVDWRAPRPRLRAELLHLLSCHEPHAPQGFRICKHGGLHGTVSASLFWMQARGGIQLEYAPGPPCTTSFTSLDLQLAPGAGTLP